MLRTFRDVGVRAFDWIKNNIPVVATFVGVLGGLFILSKVIALAKAFRIAVIAVKVAILAAASPAVLIATAIAALAAGVVYAYRRFE